MATLSLRIIAPGGAGPGSIEAKSDETGAKLKQRLQESLGMNEQLLLLYQNGSRNAAKATLEDEPTLEAQGLQDAAVVTVKTLDQEVLPADSVLRKSISKNGGSSYYYAHANEKELPHELRYVYGGAPTKLSDADAENVSGYAAAQPEIPTVAIAKYSWADEGDFVCIYISQEDEADALAAAKDGKGGEVTVNFDSKSAELTIRGDSRTYSLAFRSLENDIIPEESKHRVSAGKRVTLKLKKKRQVTWTRLVRPK